MPKKHSHKGHRQRLRDRYFKDGIESFQPHEALELYLFYAIPYKDTNELAHRLIEQFGSFSAVFDAPPSALREMGLTDNVIALLKLLPDMARLYKIDKTENPLKAVDGFGLCSYFEPYFHGMKEEVMRLLLLDKKGKELYSGIISRGSSNTTDVPIKKIVELSLYYNASFAAIAHNHPSGSARPSSMDVDATRKVFLALRLVKIRLIDHVVVADDDSVSMALSGIGIFGEDIRGYEL